MAVIVQLLGGLGNQMFQYAAGRSLAHRLELPLKLDLSKFDEYKLRSYKLSHLCVRENFATEDDLKSFSIPEVGWDLLVHSARNFILPWHLKKIINERQTGFDKDFNSIKNSCLLKGYWQSEKYFENIGKIIREEFQVKGEPDDLNREYLSEIKGFSSVSVHIRRGDYVTNPVTNKVHGFLGKNYYEKSIRHFELKIEDPVFFVFSDDIEWAKNNLKADSLLVFVDYNGEEKDYEDLRLMMNCKYHIIANSTFSWWGAWLSDYPQKKVIAPKKWFTQQMMKKEGRIDIVPERWTRL